jgi:hypothetical protein
MDEENQEKSCHDGQCPTEIRIGYLASMSEALVATALLYPE